MKFRLFCPFVLSVAAASLAWPQTNTTTDTTSESSAVIPTYNTTNVTQQVNTFQTELKARLQGGSYLFDQTYSAAFGSPTLQTAITQAESILQGAGAVSFTGPTQLSTNQSTSTSISTVQTGTDVTSTLIGVATWIGPVSFLIGNFGNCQSAILYPPTPGLSSTPPGYLEYSNCTGGSPQTFPVVPGGEDIDTRVTTYETISQTVTTTNTTLTSSVYEIDGIPAVTAPVPAAPSPPALILALLGLACLGLYGVRWRKAHGAASS